jgi:hypothetical protein
MTGLPPHHGRGFGSMGRGGGGAGVREKAGCSVSVSDFGRKSGALSKMMVNRR